MNLLLLTWNYPPAVGGIEQVAYHMAVGLHGRGHHIRIVAGHTDDPSADGDASFEIMRATRPGLKAFLIHALRTGWRLARADKPDAFVCPSVTSGPAAWILSKLLGVPYAVLIHGSDLLVPSRLYQLGLKPILRGAQCVFANSDNTARLIRLRGVAPERVRIVCPGVTPVPAADGEPSEAIASLLRTIADKPTLVTVGRLVKRKGIEEFILDVMPRLAEVMPDVHYLVVGGEPNASLIHHERILDRLEQAIETSQQESRVHLLGSLSDPDREAVYGGASLFVLPCREDPADIEGFGIVILEAALHGMPAVATRCGGIPSAIDDGVTGKLVPPGDAPAMTDAILEILETSGQWKRMGEAANERARTEFSWPTVAGRYEAGLQAMCRS